MGSGWRQWTRERLAAATLQGYIQDQVVQAYGSAATRLSTGPGGSSLTDGMMSVIHGLATGRPRLGVAKGAAWLEPEGLGDIGAVAGTGGSQAVASTTQARWVASYANWSGQLEAGRLYELSWSGVAADGDTAPQQPEIFWRGTSGAGSAPIPTASSVCVGHVSAVLTTVGRPITLDSDGQFVVPTTGLTRISAFIRRNNATGTATFAPNVHVTAVAVRVRDRGPAPAGYPVVLGAA